MTSKNIDILFYGTLAVLLPALFIDSIEIKPSGGHEPSSVTGVSAGDAPDGPLSSPAIKIPISKGGPTEIPPSNDPPAVVPGHSTTPTISTTAPVPTITWTTWAKALEQSKQARQGATSPDGTPVPAKPILIHYTREDCRPCQVLERKVFSQAPIRRVLSKFICVRRKPQPGGRAPSDIFISPDRSTVIKTYSPVPLTNFPDYQDLTQAYELHLLHYYERVKQ